MVTCGNSDLIALFLGQHIVLAFQGHSCNPVFAGRQKWGQGTGIEECLQMNDGSQGRFQEEQLHRHGQDTGQLAEYFVLE